MYRVAFAVPELPGKDARSIPAFVKSRFDEYVRSRKRIGATMERIFRMPTPMGTFVIAYIESDKPFAEANAAMAASPDPFDKEFMRRLADVHGLDFSRPPPGPGPEVLAEWFDPAPPPASPQPTPRQPTRRKPCNRGCPLITSISQPDRPRYLKLGLGTNTSARYANVA